MTYSELLNNLQNLKNIGVRCGSIGRSVLGKKIPFAKVGFGKYNIVVQAAIHAREYATASIALLQLQYLSQFDLQDFSVYVVPMSNPDGVDICIKGIDDVQSTYLKNKLYLVNSGYDFGTFKANANCVDLNVNFDAKWGTGDSNLYYPHTENFVGNFANDQPETKALINLCKQLQPVATLSYHSRGREIFWDFFASSDIAARDLNIAENLAASARYKVSSSQNTSAGGFKDWCIKHLKVPSFTVEFFDEDTKYPIDRDQILQEYHRTREIPLVLMQDLRQILS